MYLLNKTLFSLVEIELKNLSKVDAKKLDISSNYIINSFALMPWFFRYPFRLMIFLINIPSLFFNRSMFFRLSIKERAKLWSNLSRYPGYSSLKRLIRTLALLSVYSEDDKSS
jgi:hypothetical protein